MFTSVNMAALLIGILCTWRVTHLLWGEDGPGDVLVRFRQWMGQGFFARLLDCFYCLSLWVAAPVAWLMGAAWAERALLWFGISGGAILLERATSRPPHFPPPPHWREEPLPDEPEEETHPEGHKEGYKDVMLR